MLSKQYLTFGAFLAAITLVSALTAPDPEAGLIIIQQSDFLNGTLTW